PMILVLKNRTPCVLQEITANDATIFLGGIGEKTQKIKLSELGNNYTGTAILISPTHRFDDRAKEPGKPLPLPWFWNVMKKAWAVYSEILIASFLINVFALASPLFIMNV